MEVLRTATDAYDTHLAREALQTAEHLVRGCHEKKMEDATWVGQALAVINGNGWKPEEKDIGQMLPEALPRFEWPTEDDGGWMEIFFNMGMEQ